MPLLPPNRSAAGPSANRCIRRAAQKRGLRLALAWFAATSLLAGEIAAQQAQPQVQRRHPRTVVFTVGGAAVGALLGGVLAKAFGSDGSAVAAVGGAVGLGAAGYFLGKDADRLHALRFQDAPPIRSEIISLGLGSSPAALAVRGNLIVVAGRTGFSVVESGIGLSMRASRGAGLSGIADLDIVSDDGAVLIAAGSGTYLFPPVSGGGRLLRAGASGAAAAGAGRLFFALGSRVESAPADADSLREWPGLDAGARVRSLAFDSTSRLLWAATDSGVVAIRPNGDSLTKVSMLMVGGVPTGIAAQGSRLAVALGAAGVRVYDVGHPDTPRQIGSWQGARFVFDVALSGPHLFAAAGQAGVYVLDVRSGEPAALGLARDLGYATSIASSQGFLYVLDRSRNELRRTSSPL